MSSLSESIIQFAVDLFQQIRRSEGGNIFYSPLSIMSALAMTYLGSRGHTASEIRKVGGSFLSFEHLALLSLLARVQGSQIWLCPGVPQKAASIPMTGWLRAWGGGHTLSPSGPPTPICFPVPSFLGGAGANACSCLTTSGEAHQMEASR